MQRHSSSRRSFAGRRFALVVIVHSPSNLTEQQGNRPPGLCESCRRLPPFRPVMKCPEPTDRPCRRQKTAGGNSEILWY